MARNKILIENYGLNPPENSRPFWEDNNAFDEDKTVFKIDLQTSLQKLDPTEKEIIKLFNDGYSERETSEILEMNDTAVHRIKEEALNKLKEMMNGEDNLYSLFATDTERN